MKHCLVFVSLISPSKMILFEKKYQTFSTLFSVFHLVMKHCISYLIYYINTKRLMELAFLRYEELCRSHKVSSAEADNTLLDLPYLFHNTILGLNK